MKKLRKFVENPYVNIFIGLILLLSGLYEAWGTLYEDAIGAKLVPITVPLYLDYFMC